MIFASIGSFLSRHFPFLTGHIFSYSVAFDAYQMTVADIFPSNTLVSFVFSVFSVETIQKSEIVYPHTITSKIFNGIIFDIIPNIF